MKKAIGIFFLILLCIVALLMPWIISYMAIAWDGDVRVEEGTFDGWQTVVIKNIGTIKLPEEWLLTQEGSAIYITSALLEEPVILAVGIVDSAENNITIWDLIKNVEPMNSNSSSGANYSNHASYGKYQYLINGNIEERFRIILDGKSTLFIYDATVEEETVINISKSFRRPTKSSYKDVEIGVTSIIAPPLLHTTFAALSKPLLSRF